MPFGCDFSVNFAPFLNQKITKIASWRRLGASSWRLEPSWKRLEASWSRLGSSWRRLGASWKRLIASGSVLRTLQSAKQGTLNGFCKFWGGEAVDACGRAMGTRFSLDP